MADEREARANLMFHRQKQHMITLLGKEALDDGQINKLAKHLFRSKWGGCFGESQFKLTGQTNKFYVLNTSKAGTHWVAVVVGGAKTVYVYDSFGRATGLILRHFKRECERKGYRIVESKRDRPEQSDSSSVCGQMCIAWLYTAKQLGVKMALLI
jgi:hypothetical protein